MGGWQWLLVGRHQPIRGWHAAVGAKVGEVEDSAEHVLFGSDYPHPEGMADPLAYYDIVKDLPIDQQKMIMGGSIEKALKVGAYAT